MAQAKTIDVRDENGDGHRRGDRSVEPHGHAQEIRRHLHNDTSPGIARFAELKLGDKVTARFYENVIVQVRRSGNINVNTAAKADPAEQVLPGGTRAKQRTISANITAIDMNVPWLTLPPANGWRYRMEGAGHQALAEVEGGAGRMTSPGQKRCWWLEPGK